MEILVVCAIITVLAAIAYPIIIKVRQTANKAEAVQRMKALVAATGNFAAANNGDLPAEDAMGKDDWETTKKPEADKAWYNALPRMMGQKGVGDFVKEGRTAAYYTKENSVYLPGAQYPESRKMEKPYFAIAINTKLHRKERDAAGVKATAKPNVKWGSIVNQSRTVLFLEQGMSGEPKASDATSSKSDYDGSCKGSAKSFVARYNHKGILAFCDGHTEEVSGKDLLTSTGAIVWDATAASTNSLSFIWTIDPKDDPNK